MSQSPESVRNEGVSTSQRLIDYQWLFETGPSLCLVLRPDLTIAAASNVYLEATMTRRQEIFGRRIFDVFPDNPADPQASGVRNLNASLQRVLESRMFDTMPVQKYDIQRRLEDGGGFEERWWSPTNSPILAPDGEVLYVVHQVQDVTDFMVLKQRGVEQVKLAQHLTHLADRLESEMQSRTRQLQEFHRRSELEQQLIGIVSHDLRNPIQSIAVGAALLLARNALSDKQRETITRILGSAERSGRLIRDLLDFTQARLSGRIPVHRRQGDLFEDLEDVLQELRGAYPDRAIEYQRVGDGNGVWDRDRMAQVVTNLVTNALAHAAPTTSVKVTARGLEHQVAVAVHNVGRPIPEALLPKLFQPLQRGDGDPGGDGRSIGLGLFISRHIATAHHGDIAVKSPDDDGTTFTLTLPRG